MFFNEIRLQNHSLDWIKLQYKLFNFQIFPATLFDLYQESKMSSDTTLKAQVKDLKEYKAFFKEVKEKILTSQVKAALAVNHELINLYWEIGSKIHLK